MSGSKSEIGNELSSCDGWVLLSASGVLLSGNDGACDDVWSSDIDGARLSASDTLSWRTDGARVSANDVFSYIGDLTNSKDGVLLPHLGRGLKSNGPGPSVSMDILVSCSDVLLAHIERPLLSSAGSGAVLARNNDRATGPVAMGESSSFEVSSIGVEDADSEVS